MVSGAESWKSGFEDVPSINGSVFFGGEYKLSVLEIEADSIMS